MARRRVNFIHTGRLWVKNARILPLTLHQSAMSLPLALQLQYQDYKLRDSGDILRAQSQWRARETMRGNIYRMMDTNIRRTSLREIIGHMLRAVLWTMCFLPILKAWFLDTPIIAKSN